MKISANDLHHLLGQLSRTVTIDSAKTVGDAAQKMIDEDVSDVLVLKDKEPIGVFEVKDINLDELKKPLKDVSLGKVSVIKDGQKQYKLSDILADISAYVVTSEANEDVTGLVTRDDLLKLYARNNQSASLW